MVISRIIGVRCISTKEKSLDFTLISEFVAVIVVPWFIDVYIYKEYAAVKNLTSLSIIILHEVEDIIEVINIISLSKLIVGGAAMFLAVNRNHHIVRDGIRTITPLVIYSLRVDVIS